MIQRALVWLLYTAHQRALAARRAHRAPSVYLGYALLSGAIQGVLLALVAALVVGIWAVGLEPLAIVLGALGAAPLLGPALVRSVLAPLGAVRAAYYVGRTSLAGGADPEGYALACAAWAVLRRPRPGGEAWLRTRLAARGATGDAEVVAHALLAAAHGDDVGARVLLESTVLLVERHAAVRELAAEHLAAVDLARDADAEILARAADPAAWPASALTFLVEGLVERRLGRPGAPTTGALWGRWALAPRRRHTFALVRAAIASRPAPQPEPVAASRADTAPAGDAAETLHLALRGHLGVLAGRPGAAALDASGRAWDAALDDAGLRLRAQARAVALGLDADAGDEALRTLADQATRDLAEFAAAAGVPVLASAGVGTAASAAHRARHARLAEVEVALGAWRARADARTALPAIDEWRTFLAQRALHAAAVEAGGLELRRLLFPHLLSAGSHVAAWLWNERKEHVLSHAISQLLLAEALAVGDAMAIEHEGAHARLVVPARSL